MSIVLSILHAVQVNIGLRVLTRPMPAALPELYRTLGTDYAERVLPSIIQVNSKRFTQIHGDVNVQCVPDLKPGRCL